MAIRTPVIVGTLAALHLVVAIVLVWWVGPDSLDHSTISSLVLIGGLSILSILSIIFLWILIKKTVIKPIASIERGAEIILKTHAAHDIETPANHQLGQLPDLIHQLGDEISSSRQQISRALQSGGQKSDALNARLEQIISGLDEGVLVCNSASRIQLYNPSASQILNNHPALGLGRSLYSILPISPIQHTLDILRMQETSESEVELESSDFMCSVNDQDHMLHCRIALLPGEESADSDILPPRGFVMTFEDVTVQQESLKERNRILRKSMEQLRSPLANLRAAVETLQAFDDMDDAQRGAFIGVVSEESSRLSHEVDELGKASGSLVGSEWVLADIYSTDLINSVARELEKKDHIEVTMTGIPLWLSVDSHAMVGLLVFCTERIHELRNISKFDIEVLLGNNTTYLDLSWEGEEISQTEMSDWQDQTLTDLVGSPTVYDILHQIGSEIWSQSHPRIDGHSIIRIPLPVSSRQWEPTSEKLPPRPVSYDFDIEDLDTGDNSMMAKNLRDLEFVVFDTETTGLHIENGDQVIQIGGVRVVNQRILSNETFDELIHPGRQIPKSSIRFHGITDEMVQKSPPLEDILPSFKAFVGDAVLVAHNAWFDMPFLRAKEVKAGVRFDNPVLDTLVLSVCLHGQDVDQSLDAILNRLGIEVYGRHSALGDSFATAELLLKLIDLLEARDILTLQDAINAYHTTKY